MSPSPAMLSLLILLPLVALATGWLLGRRRAQQLEVELAIARTELKSTEALAHEREQALALASERLRAGFDAAASEALRGNSEMFLQMAGQVLGQQRERGVRDLADREQAVAAMLAPVREALQQTREQIARIEKERAETFGALRASLEGVTLGQQALQRETRNLVTALRRPEVRGQWGEMTLRRLVELAGMVEHCDFVEQLHVPGEDGAQRPDMIVNMPDGRQLVVDVKTPLDAYLSAVEAPDDAARDASPRGGSERPVRRDPFASGEGDLLPAVPEARRAVADGEEDRVARYLELCSGDLVYRAELRQGPRDGAPGAAARAGGEGRAGGGPGSFLKIGHCVVARAFNATIRIP